MFSAASLLSYALLAATAFAAPRGSGLEARIARRQAGAHKSGPRLPATGTTTLVNAGNNSHVAFSSNWAGAAFESAANTYRSVTGTFVVPTPRAPSGGSGQFAASAWVGIDGDTCGSAILQTGIDFIVTNGRVTFDAWYEYFPDFAHDFTGINVSAGNTITLTVTASSATRGTATITNVSTGQTVSMTLTSTARLCFENAEWIVEDFESGGALVPFANFGTVTFSNARATTQAGATVGPAGSVLIDIEQNNRVLTSVSSGTSSVTVSYAG